MFSKLAGNQSNCSAESKHDPLAPTGHSPCCTGGASFFTFWSLAVYHPISALLFSSPLRSRGDGERSESEGSCFKWEVEQKKPTGAALKLLHLVEQLGIELVS